MKYNKYKYLVAAVCAASTTMTLAQETEAAEADTLSQEKVQLAFREADASDVLVGVSSVDVEKLMEKNYFTYSLDNMMSYAAGWNGNSMWGSDGRLVVVDGVPNRDINNLKPEEIESISFLKGANATALYGSHGAKGVILVKTKRGSVAPLRTQIRVNTGFHVAKSFPEFIGSAEYMKYYNEACAADGKDALYDDETIYHFGSGENPYRYPSVDFYSSDYIKKAYNRSDISAQFDGGSERTRYYANIGYYHEKSFMNFGEAKNSFNNRFNVRGNLDINISDYISARIDANVTFYNEKRPQGGSYWEAAARFRPNLVSPWIPVSYIDPNAQDALTKINASAYLQDGMFLGGTQSDKTNIIADQTVAGKKKTTSRSLQFTAGVGADLSPVVQGLKFGTSFSIDYESGYELAYSDQYRIFEPVWSNYNGKDVIMSVNTYNVDRHSGKQNVNNGRSNMNYAFDAHFDYDRTIDEHTFGAVLAARGYQNRKTGQYHSESDASMGLNLRYDFAKRYFVDVTGTMVHTAKLAEKKRNALSKSATIGWNLANESFLEGGIFNNLTLSASASQLYSDMDIDGYTKYMASYSLEGAWWAWTNQSGQSTISTSGANPDLEMIKHKELSAGLKGELLDHKLSFAFSAFKRDIEGLLITSEAVMPEYMKAWYPQNSSFISNVNYNNNQRQGFDFMVGYKTKIGEVDFAAELNGTYYTNKATRRDDTQYEFDYQKREGKYLDGVWGYECEGFIKDEAEAAKYAEMQKGFGQGAIKPGDLKYKDQNNDGVIDGKDTVELGRGGWYGAPFAAGLNLTASYQGFTLFVVTNYTGGSTICKYGDNDKGHYFAPYGDQKYSTAVRDHWTDKNPNASMPRLSTVAAPNNCQTSDFWTFKESQFNITKVQLTYDLPKTLFEGSKVLQAAQVYVSGSDLLKISKEREYLELNVGSAPQTRFYNLGVKVTF